MVSFLNEIHHSVAEALPDFRDEGFDEEPADVETTVEVVGGSDPYTECLNDKVQSAMAKPKAKAKGKGLRKIRKMSKSSKRWDTTCWHAKPSKLHTIIICMLNTWTDSPIGNPGVSPGCNPHPSQLFVTEWIKASSTIPVEKRYVPKSSQHSNVQKPTLWELWLMDV